MKTQTIIICFALYWLCACSGEESVGEKKVGQKPVAVEVGIARKEWVDEFMEAVGTVKAKQSAVLSSKIAGNVVAIHVREGDSVKRGQLLIDIDSRELEAELRVARASLESAEWTVKAAESAAKSAIDQRELALITYKRFAELLPKDSITRQEFDEARAKLQIADAEVARTRDHLKALNAKKNQDAARVSQSQTLLAYAKVRAPFDGVVTNKGIEVGSFASPGVPLMTVEQADNYRLEAEVGESRIAAVAVGHAVALVIDALSREVVGTVAEIVPAADPNSRTLTVKVTIPPVAGIRSGLYGKARFPLGKKEVLVVPHDAIVKRGQLVALFVVDANDIARFRLVKTGKRHGDLIEIISGLTAGERVVTKNVNQVSDGRKLLS